VIDVFTAVITAGESIITSTSEPRRRLALAYLGPTLAPTKAKTAKKAAPLKKTSKNAKEKARLGRAARRRKFSTCESQRSA